MSGWKFWRLGEHSHAGDKKVIADFGAMKRYFSWLSPSTLESAELLDDTNELLNDAAQECFEDDTETSSKV